MPPKPKGLKASKRAAPFDPSTAAGTDEQPSTSTEKSVERTYPLDEDCLTLSDLFELRLTVLELLYPFPTDLLISQADPDKLDEARSFLRGILHGCAVLEQYVARSFDTVDGPEDDARSEDKVEARRAQAGKEKLDALGLKEDDPLVEGLVLYLQAWSLHQLGEIFEDPKQEIKAAALKIGGGGGGASGPSAKKRKIDLNEPRSKIEWFEAAHEKYRIAHDDVSQAYQCNGDADHLLMSLTSADLVRCQVSLARACWQAGQEDKARDLVGEEAYETLSLRAHDDAWGIGSEEHECLEFGDAILAQLRVWAEIVAYIEQYPQLDADEDLKALDTVAKTVRWGDITQALERMEEEAQGKLKEHAALWKWLQDVVFADAKMARFIKLEDAIEAEYRPEEDEEVEDEEDESEGQVKELPMDAEDVQSVKKAGEEAVAAVRKTIADFATLPASVAHPAGKDGQYRKLEEVLLIASALVNPSDTEATLKAEAEIEQVRKEGGLLVEEEGDGK
ncbi:hypothetical protein JCM3766R1_002469 [Sporobolomyces carnicolor]